MQVSTSFKIFITSIFFFVGGFITNNCSAQNRTIIRQKKTQQHAVNNTRPLNTKLLARKITRGATSEIQKTKAIFDWLATNISYDNELRSNKNLQKKIYTSEENVMRHALKRKKALCGGYAFLFNKLCEDVGVRAESIHGFTKQPHQQINTSRTPTHTWNAVHINGRWQLLDITWAVSHGSHKKPQRFWFLTKPSDFNRTHIPKKKKWTLAATFSSK